MLTAALLDKTRFHAEVLSGPQTGSEGSLIDEVQQLGVPLTILPELVREINPLKDFIALLKLIAFIKKGDYDIVHTHSSKAGLLGRIAARLAGAPVVVHTVHGWSFHDWMPSWRRRLYICLEKIAAAVSDTMVVVARNDQEKGVSAGIGGECPYRLIRSAIPLEKFVPERYDRLEIRQALGIPTDALVLGNVGRFSPQKNPLDWVRIANMVSRRIPSCWFLMIGDGPLRRDVEARLADFDIKRRTVLTGLRRDVPRMMAAMDVFLLTSLWEGLPRVVPQAMAMGLPVVANAVDGLLEAVDHGRTGYVCPPGELETMAEHCVALLQDSGLRRQIGNAGRMTAHQEFDVKVMVEKIECLYNELLSQKERT